MSDQPPFQMSAADQSLSQYEILLKQREEIERAIKLHDASRTRTAAKLRAELDQVRLRIQEKRLQLLEQLRKEV
jgi:hypothetical protein